MTAACRLIIRPLLNKKVLVRNEPCLNDNNRGVHEQRARVATRHAAVDV